MKSSAPIAAVLLSALAVRGLAAADPQVIPLAQEQRVPKLKTVTLGFDLPQAPVAGQQVRLALQARVEYPSCANNPALTMAVNGKDIVGGDLLNKPLEYTDKNGRDVFWALEKGSTWYLYSWPDFSLENAWACASPYAIALGVDPFTFVLDITALVKAGPNTVSFTHQEIVSDLDHYVVLRDVRIEVGPPVGSTAASRVAPAPTGPLPTYVPSGAQRVAMTAELSEGGAMRLQVGQRRLDLTTRTSEPDGKWTQTGADSWQTLTPGQSAKAHWAGQGYRVDRTVTLNPDYLHVADTFTNTGTDLRGLMLEHSLRLPEAPLEVKLAGAPPYAAYHNEAGGANPTALVRWPDLAVGLVAVDDIFRTHAREFARPDAVGLADHELGLDPGQAHTLEWSVYPVPGGDYWDFINAVRRTWGANFTIPGPDLFVDWSTGGKPLDDEALRQWINARGLTMVNSYDAMFDAGHAAMGTAIPLATQFCARTAAWVRQLHRVAPGVQALVYMNSTLCTEPGAAEKYADSRLLDAGGTQQTIAAGSPQGLTMAPNFICTLENSYGKAMLQVCRYLVTDLGADGLYHDVFNFGYSYGGRAYGTMWDGCTVTIDPATHRVTGKASSLVLLQQPWVAALVAYLREHGKTIMANGPVETRTMLGLRIPVFVETGFSFSSLCMTHLGSPWGYANHPVPDPARGLYAGYAYQLRRQLDYGGVMAIPSWNEPPVGQTFLHLLYPITPLEIRAGMILGGERILTNRSGRFGWPDGSAAEVYVFAADGQRVPSPSAREVREDGRRLFELRLPGDHFAILVRQTERGAVAPRSK